jgi:hypothetical protein
MDWLLRRRPRVTNAGELGEFLSRYAAFIAQKCAEDYCRNKVGLSHYALGEEKTYRDAMTVCRLEGYVAVLASLAAVTQRFLLDAGFDPGRTEAGLVAVCGTLLAQHPAPPGRPPGWQDALAALPERLRAARAEPPPSFAELAAIAGRRLFEVLPIHASYREYDEPVVIGSVQFNFVGFSDRFRREADLSAVGRDLAAQGAIACAPPPAGSG